MQIIPFEVRGIPERGPLVIVLVLEKDNLDRMKKADPFDVQFSDYEKHMNVSRRLRELDLVIAYEEDTASFWNSSERATSLDY